MQIISCEIEKNHTEKGEVVFVDFSILGFKRSKDKKKIDMYYLFADASGSKNFYIIKESFLLDQNNIDNEMAYLNHPIHETIDMDKYTPFKKDAVRKIIERCNATNSFYCEFSAEDIINEDVAICKGIQYTLNKVQATTNFVIPLSFYMRIQIIKNALIFKLPIDASIDKNPVYNDMKFEKVNTVTYIGSEFYKDKGFVNYYSLRQEQTTTGVFLPVVGGKKILFEKNMDTKKFNSLYKNCFQIDLHNIMILDWVEDKKKKQVLCIFKKTDIKSPVYYYILDDNLKESIILNPYKCFE